MEVNGSARTVPLLPVEFARPILVKEAWCYDVPFMDVTTASQPMPVDKQGTNMTVGTVAEIRPVDEQAICLIA